MVPSDSDFAFFSSFNCATEARRVSATVMAPSSGVFGSITANSSPPIRAVKSLPLTDFCMFFAIILSILSPTICPCVSLNFLK